VSVLTYTQAAVLCRVNDMPTEQFIEHLDKWKDCQGYAALPVTPETKFRLHPGSPLTRVQAAHCLAVGLTIEDRGQDDGEFPEGGWMSLNKGRYDLVEIRQNRDYRVFKSGGES